MKTVCNKLENCKVEVKVSVEAEEWKAAQEKALKKLAQSVRIDGFRKGKVPAKLVKARIGDQAICEEAFNELLSTSYTNIITDNHIEPVAQPEVSVDTINVETLEFTVTVTVVPEFELGQYKELEVKKTAVKVTKKEIDEELTNYQNQFAELVIKDGAVEDGDTAVIDFAGEKDGVAFEGGTSENYSLVIGSNSFIPGFEEQIIGMKPEEEKDINVTFPEDYHVEDLAGQPVVFHVKLHEVKSKVLPEIDDELAKDVNVDGIETLEDLKTYVKEQIKNRKDKEAEDKFSEDVVKALIEKTPFYVPDAMIETETGTMLREVEQNLMAQGIDMKMFLQFSGKTEDDLRADFREQAEERVRFNLIINQIVKAEDIKPTDEEVDEEYENISQYYGRDAAEVKKLLADRDDTIRNEISFRKAVQFVKDNVK